MLLLAPSGLETPFVGMMLLTLLVWLYMYVRRLSWAAANPAAAQRITTPEKLASNRAYVFLGAFNFST